MGSEKGKRAVLVKLTLQDGTHGLSLRDAVPVDGELGVWNQVELFTSEAIDEGRSTGWRLMGRVLPVLDTIFSPGSVHSKQWAKRL